jgi:hypothetical protein
MKKSERRWTLAQDGGSIGRNNCDC